MTQLSRDISTVSETDYDWNSIEYKKVSPLLDGKCIKFNNSFETNVSDWDCKTTVKSDMTWLWYTRDTEV